MILLIFSETSSDTEIYDYGNNNDFLNVYEKYTVYI